MKAPQNDKHVTPHRRQLFGALAGAVTGLVGLKLGRSERTVQPPAAPLADAALDPVPSTSPSRIVVKPAPHSVKRHG